MKSVYVSPEFEIEEFKITQDLLNESGTPDIEKGEEELGLKIFLNGVVYPPHFSLTSNYCYGGYL